MSDKWVNASEVAEYVYCSRAWWLRHAQGLRSANVRQMESGSAFHRRHSRRVHGVLWLRRAAYVLIFVAVFLVVFQTLLGG
jgi:CRISPR/Cas system-associated exonuclease Cas4 (RecB family)